MCFFVSNHRGHDVLLGLSIYATVVGSIGALLLNLDASNHQWLEKFASVDRFIQGNHLPRTLAMRVHNHYSHLRELGKSPVGTGLLEELPDSLQNDISLHLLADTLREVDVFRNAPKSVLSLVASKLVPKSFPPGERVVTEGDSGDSMFFVLHGLLEVMIGSRVVSVLSEGGRFGEERGGSLFLIVSSYTDVFGEISLFLKLPRTATVRCIVSCDLFELKSEQLKSVLSKFPSISVRWIERFFLFSFSL